MTKLKQLNPNYPKGDCQRTVFACLLGCESPLDIPNFTEMESSLEEMKSKFVSNVYEWVNRNDLNYVEIDIETFKKSAYVQTGYCTIVGKSPRGDYNHIVIGEISLNKDNLYELRYVWDTNPEHDGAYLDGEPEFIGFLSRKL